MAGGGHRDRLQKTLAYLPRSRSDCVRRGGRSRVGRGVLLGVNRLAPRLEDVVVRLGAAIVVAIGVCVGSLILFERSIGMELQRIEVAIFWVLDLAAIFLSPDWVVCRY
jgi:hypothetical protein